MRRLTGFVRNQEYRQMEPRFNQILQVDPSHLIRMSVGVGFRRARLRYAYLLLRGKNLKTGEITQDVR